MTALAGVAAAFFLMHLYPSTPLRCRSVGLIGEGVYSAVFSILSLVLIWWMTQRFNAAPYGDKLWIMPGWWYGLKAVLILFALVLIVGGMLTPNPSSPGAARFLNRADIGSGIFAITRHPVMWGIAIWAVCHLVSQATPRGFAFFGAFAATALVGVWLQERRKRATIPAWNAFASKTSFFPFAALAEGRAKLSLTALGWWRLALAAVLWAAVLHFHSWLFGVQPLDFRLAARLTENAFSSVDWSVDERDMHRFRRSSPHVLPAG